MNSEGPKLQKRHGFYYISLPEGGFQRGGQTMLRSKNILGPYERKEVLAGTGEHQGGFVDLDNGQSWFIGFKEQYNSSAALGRICYLEPVTWGDDDWPVFGDKTQPVSQWKKPDVGKTYDITRPATSDDFSSTTLGLQWQWNHNPVDDHWSLKDRPGFLRLKASPADSLSLAHNTLTQKLWDDAGIIDVKLDLTNLADSGHAGLAFMTGSRFGTIGVTQSAGTRTLEWDNKIGPALTSNTLYLRGTYQGIDCHFAYSTDGTTFSDAPNTFKMGFTNWKGGRPALYSYGPAGSIDIDYFHYHYGKTLQEAN
jgi:beta-xylosidase